LDATSWILFPENLKQIMSYTSVSSNKEFSFCSLQPPAQAGSSLADFSTLKMEAIRSSERSVHTSSTHPHITKDGILHSHRYENLKSYIFIDGLYNNAV
jgi:hypothetical protein